MTDSPSLSRRRVLVGAALSLGASSLVARAAVAQAPVALKVATGPTEATAQGYYAQDRGFFRRYGLDVELVRLRSGPVAMAAMVAGDLQIGVGNTLSLAAAHQRNLPFVMIAPGALYDASHPTAMIVTAPDSEIKTAKDLVGKTVGVISLGSIDQLTFDAYLDKSGVANADLKFVELPPSAMADAVAQGRVQAAILNDPDLSIALDAGTVRPFAPGYASISKLFMTGAWFAVESWLAQNKDVARRFAAAVSEAGVWANVNPDAAVAILRKNSPVREGRARVQFARRLDIGLIQPVFDSATKYKLLGTVNAADFSWNGR